LEHDDTAVATIGNTQGERGKVTGVGPGTVVIRAHDPVSGVDSNDSGQNGGITVLGPLVSIELSPASATDNVGEERFFTAKGHFEGGTEKNLTQDLTYFVGQPRGRPGDERGRCEEQGPRGRRRHGDHPGDRRRDRHRQQRRRLHRCALITDLLRNGSTSW
jgi:hypothetical protein